MVINNNFRVIAKDRARMTVACQQIQSLGAPMKCKLHVHLKDAQNSADLETDLDLPDTLTAPGSTLNYQGLPDLIVEKRHYDADQRLCLVYCRVCTLPLLDLNTLQKNGWTVSGHS